MSADTDTGYQPTVIPPTTPPAVPDTPPADQPPVGQLEPADVPDTGPDKVADLEALTPEPPGELVVAGVPCVVNRVRTRELMLLARVLTRGVGENMSMVDMSGPDADSQLLGLLVVAIPESGDEVLDLLRVLIQPQERITEEGTRKAFAAEMANPDTATTLDALAIMVAQEKETFPLLVGKFRMLFKAASALWAKKADQEQHNAAQVPVVGER